MINQLLYNKIINLHFIIFRRIIKQFDPDNKELLKKIQEADESTFSIRGNGNDVVKSKPSKSAYSCWVDDKRRTNPLFRSMTTTEKQSFTSQLKQMWKNNPVLQAPYQIKAAELIILKYDGLEGKLNNYSFEVVN